MLSGFLTSQHEWGFIFFQWFAPKPKNTDDELMAYLIVFDQVRLFLFFNLEGVSRVIR